MVHRIVNRYHNSNTYILECGANSVIVIDVGDSAANLLPDWLQTHDKKLIGVLLTHEHGDHCAGIDELHEKLDFPLYCHEDCAQNIKNARQNFSFYTEDLPTFEVAMQANSVVDGDVLNFDETIIKVLHTPGHSPGGCCFLAGDFIFTGDTILNKTRTPLSLPHSNKIEYFKSLKKLSQMLKQQQIIYPGHDTPFSFHSMNLLLNQISEGRASFSEAYSSAEF